MRQVQRSRGLPLLTCRGGCGGALSLLKGVSKELHELRSRDPRARYNDLHEQLQLCLEEEDDAGATAAMDQIRMVKTFLPEHNLEGLWVGRSGYSRRALYPPQHSPAPQPAHRFSLRSPQDGSIFCLGSPRRPTSTSLARFPRRPEHGTARARLLARAPSSKSRRAFVGKTSDATLLSSRGG